MADLDVPLGMLYMLEPVRIDLQTIWARFNVGYRSPMALSSGPIVTKKQEILSLRYATTNYGGQTRISRIEMIGTDYSQRGVAAFQDSSLLQELALSVF